MPREMYAQVLQQVQTLDYEQKLEMINVLTNSLKMTRPQETASVDDKIKKIATFKGCMKGLWAKDALDYQNGLREDRSVAQ